MYNYEKVEKLDELVTPGVIHAEQECRHNVQLPWSKEINKTITQVNILWIHLSSLRKNIDCSDQIEKTIIVKSKTMSTNNKKRNNRTPQRFPKAGTDPVERITS